METRLPAVLTAKARVHKLVTLTPDTLDYGHPRTVLAPTANRLLANLPAADYQRLAPHLEPVDLRLGWVIHEVGDPLNYAYFPTGGIFARLSVLSDGSNSEVAITGNEGLIGVSLCMGTRHSPWRKVVQIAGHAYRLPAKLLLEEFARGGRFQHLLLDYTQAVLTEMAQTAMCYRRHSIEQQFCRLPLTFLDRLPGNKIVLTQEMIASLLGVRREGVTAAARRLQSAGAITYRRGHISVLDRPALEQRVCECYAVVKKEVDRLL